MYADMEQWNDIRKRVLVEGVSKRSILRETGMHWCTTKNVELFSKLKTPRQPREHLFARRNGYLPPRGVPGNVVEYFLQIAQYV